MSGRHSRKSRRAAFDINELADSSSIWRTRSGNCTISRYETQLPVCQGYHNQSILGSRIQFRDDCTQIGTSLFHGDETDCEPFPLPLPQATPQSLPRESGKKDCWSEISWLSTLYEPQAVLILSKRKLAEVKALRQEGTTKLQSVFLEPPEPLRYNPECRCCFRELDVDLGTEPRSFLSLKHTNDPSYYNSCDNSDCYRSTWQAYGEKDEEGNARKEPIIPRYKKGIMGVCYPRDSSLQVRRSGGSNGGYEKVQLGSN